MGEFNCNFGAPEPECISTSALCNGTIECSLTGIDESICAADGESVIIILSIYIL